MNSTIPPTGWVARRRLTHVFLHTYVLRGHRGRHERAPLTRSWVTATGRKPARDRWIHLVYIPGRRTVTLVERLRACGQRERSQVASSHMARARLTPRRARAAWEATGGSLNVELVPQRAGDRSIYPSCGSGASFTVVGARGGDCGATETADLLRVDQEGKGVNHHSHLYSHLQIPLLPP